MAGGIPFATTDALKTVIAKVNQQQERIIALSLMNLEMAKLLIESGGLSRERYLEILDAISKSFESSGSLDGAKQVRLVWDLISQQTVEKPHDQA